MNRIKIISVLAIIIALVSCSKDDYKLDSNYDSFVRFNFLTSAAGVPLEYPTVSTTLRPTASYDNKSLKTLKIPVTLTAKELKSTVKVNFSSTTSGDINSYSMEPKSQLSFEGNKLTDTIFVSFDKRWADKQSITLKLENASDTEIHIGNLNTVAPNDVFTINLGEINTLYTFPVPQYTIKGEVGETVDFKVNFPNGFIPSEIENANIFKFTNGFDYSLTHDDLGDNRSSITYHLTLLEDLQNDDTRYTTKINLINTPNYIATGNTSLTIVKPPKTPRDIQAYPALKFSDPKTPFYLTYTELWFERNGVCSWNQSSTLTFPVKVTKDAENAILYSDNGTTNPNDDVYHDAFKIGFNVTNGNNTVNSFGIKRWFSNESGSASISPGFNITSALEFFPENGNNKTKGTVIVIPQDLTIGSSTSSHIIAISGEGTYKEISNGLFEISFELKLTNEKVFKDTGGSATTQCKIYNNKVYPAPAHPNIPCPKEVTLP